MAPRKIPGVTSWRNGDGTTSFRIRWRQGGGRGPQLSHTFTRQGEAVDALTQIRANGNVCTCKVHAPSEPAVDLELGRLDASSVASFGGALRFHVDHLTGVGEGYRRDFVVDLERHFAELLDRPLTEITASDVKEWLRGCELGSHPWLLRRTPGSNNWVTRPLGVKTTRRLLVQASAIYRERGLPSPFAGHRLARDDNPVIRALTPEQWALLEVELPEPAPRDLCRALLGTGARFGEMTAVRVGDVDPFRKTLRVDRAWKADGRNGYVLGPPKSRKSRRVIDLDDATLDALLPHLAGKGPDELVFTTLRGAPVRSANFSHRVWRPAVARAVAKGLPFSPRIHDLRHTCATWLISGGVNPILVSRQLGHESYQTTANIYADVLPKDRGEATRVMARALESARRRVGSDR